MIALVAAIPPPPFSSFHLGPLTIRMYGIMIGLGVLAGVWLAGRLFEERGIGDIDDAASIAVWGVFAGIIGARFYHVITDFQNFQNGNFIDAFKVWKPGLGVPGGILFGTLAGVWAARRRGLPILPALSCAAPAIPLAQAIGRFGNYFNEELYGRPTTLPWGLEVSKAVNTGYPAGTLFHPTFLYEPLWNFALCAGLVWLFHHRPKLQPGRLFPLYLIGYGTGRLWIESLRIDPANKIGPFRTNVWMSLILIAGGLTWFIMTRDSTARWPHPLRIGGYQMNEEGERFETEPAVGRSAPDRDDADSDVAHDDPNRDDSESGRAGDDTSTDAEPAKSAEKDRSTNDSEATANKESAAARSSSGVEEEPGVGERTQAAPTGSAPAKRGARSHGERTRPVRKSTAKSDTEPNRPQPGGTSATAADTDNADADTTPDTEPTPTATRTNVSRSRAKKLGAKRVGTSPDGDAGDTTGTAPAVEATSTDSTPSGVVDPGLAAARRAADTGDEQNAE